MYLTPSLPSIHTYIHTYMHTYIHTYIHTHTYIRTYTRTYTRTHYYVYMKPHKVMLLGIVYFAIKHVKRLSHLCIRRLLGEVNIPLGDVSRSGATDTSYTLKAKDGSQSKVGY